MIFTVAFFSNSNVTTSTRPIIQASNRGVDRSWWRTRYSNCSDNDHYRFWSHNNVLQVFTSGLLENTLYNGGDHIMTLCFSLTSSVKFTSALCSSNTLTTSMCPFPFLIAVIRGVVRLFNDNENYYNMTINEDKKIIYIWNIVNAYDVLADYSVIFDIKRSHMI